MSSSRAAVGLALGLAFPLAATPSVPNALSASSSLPALSESVGYSVGPISDASIGCPGTGDVAEAVDPSRRYLYVEFEGCDGDDGVGSARSTDGGRLFSRPHALPGSHGGWDPSLAVAPNGTLYAAFMNTIGTRT